MVTCQTLMETYSISTKEIPVNPTHCTVKVWVREGYVLSTVKIEQSLQEMN